MYTEGICIQEYLICSFVMSGLTHMFFNHNAQLQNADLTTCTHLHSAEYKKQK